MKSNSNLVLIHVFLTSLSPHEIDATVGQTLEALGPLSGDGYTATDLGVNNVVGMTGAMNAIQISVHND